MSDPAEKSAAYFWFDAEFTSLDLDRARLLQVAAVLTDVHLHRLHPPEEDINLFIRLEEGEEMSDWVREHLASLLERCRGPEAVSVEEADRRLAAFLDRWCGPAAGEVEARPVLAGNSIHNDWFLMRRFLPRTVERLHYRLLDVTALKLQWVDWLEGEPLDKERREALKPFLPEGAPPGGQAHDALFDVYASIAELAFYRHHLVRRNGRDVEKN